MLFKKRYFLLLTGKQASKARWFYNKTNAWRRKLGTAKGRKCLRLELVNYETDLLLYRIAFMLNDDFVHS